MCPHLVLLPGIRIRGARPAWASALLLVYLRTPKILSGTQHTMQRGVTLLLLHVCMQPVLVLLSVQYTAVMMLVFVCMYRGGRSVPRKQLSRSASWLRGSGSSLSCFPLPLRNSAFTPVLAKNSFPAAPAVCVSAMYTTNHEPQPRTLLLRSSGRRNRNAVRKISRWPASILKLHRERAQRRRQLPIGCTVILCNKAALATKSASVSSATNTLSSSPGWPLDGIDTKFTN